MAENSVSAKVFVVTDQSWATGPTGIQDFGLQVFSTAEQAKACARSLLRSDFDNEVALAHVDGWDGNVGPYLEVCGGYLIVKIAHIGIDLPLPEPVDDGSEDEDEQETVDG
jgi:hypothetical protein